MSSNRGAANILRFNEERSAKVLPLLEHELKSCRKRKLEFKTVGLLATYLQDQTKIHRTTLIRNPTYRSLLLAFMAGQPGAVSRAPDTTEDPALLQAKLAAAKLDASTLREQLRALKAQVKHSSTPAAGAAPSESDVAFTDLAMVMAAVLSRLQDFLYLDFNKREMLDLSARPSERLIAGPGRIARFCVWVEQNHMLPQLQQLMKLSTEKGKSHGQR